MADVQSPLTSLTVPKVAPKGRDIGFAIGIMVILSVLFLPIPSFMIDFGLAISIASFAIACWYAAEMRCLPTASLSAWPDHAWRRPTAHPP